MTVTLSQYVLRDHIKLDFEIFKSIHQESVKELSMKTPTSKRSQYLVVIAILLAALMLACGRGSQTPTEPLPIIVTQVVEEAAPAEPPPANAAPAEDGAVQPPEEESSPVVEQPDGELDEQPAGPSSEAGSCTDSLQFISDVTVPDGTIYEANATFVKTWQLRNSGTCNWSDYRLVFESGEPMGTLDQAIPDVPAGTEVDLSIEMTAPGGPGEYTGYWQVVSGNGVSLGSIYCAISVQDSEGQQSEQPEPSEAQDQPEEQPPEEQDQPEEQEEPPEEQQLPSITPPSNLQVSYQDDDVVFTWTDGVGESGYVLSFLTESLSFGPDVVVYTWESAPCGQSIVATLIARDANIAEIGRLTVTVNTPACAVVPQGPNLIIVNAYFDPEPVVRGQEFQAHITIQNEGDVDAGAFQVTWSFNPNLGLSACVWNRELGLAAGAQFSGHCKRTVDVDPVNARTTLTVDSGEVIIESEEEDNEQVITIHISQ
jgi:hypothetical protein